MIKLDQSYDRADFIDFLQNTFLKDFARDVRAVGTPGFQAITKATTLGKSDSLDLQIFEFEYTGSANKRVTLTKEAFQIMKQSATFNALAVFYGHGSDDWRLSFLTANPQRSEKGKVTVAYSNPRRYSFFLGPNAKINTPTKFIISQGVVKDSDDLKSRFSLEVVNKDFYKEISKAFTELSNGLLKLPFVQDKSQTHLEFAVRLIGRIIFCWFLREKKSESGLSLMPHQILSLNAVLSNKDYYHQILEPIFFEVLNKPIKLRKVDFAKEPFSSVPYLNGGLFSPQGDDYYKRNNDDLQSQFHNTLVIPDTWFKDFFETLETYNFTIDENTSFDEELSIDPEMLGRIFENLLAEINPETGESARKSTGSYYTPRTIVNYMVDESLLAYLKGKTGIDEGKLRAIISYDLTDDSEYSLKSDEKEMVIDALEQVKILDPACGSGAFPIGALQKIVFILQQVDPDGQLWFKRQIENTPPEVRRVIEREFSHKNFDYIRKLGIIRENIYGVDIQPIATEISRLRCFLTLVVDERIQDDADNRGIEPLPNLDFKFVTANSLMGLPTSKVVNQMGLFEDDSGIRELKELRDAFFNATGVEREQLKLQFVQAQNRMFQRMIEEGRKGYADLTTKLSSWDPFTHKVSSWFDPEWMFGIKEGFDIVIANPPYVDSEQMVKTESDQRERYTEMFTTAKGNWDLFVIFVEKGTILLKENSSLIYIIPNKLLGASYAKYLRQHLLNLTVKEIRDYSRIDVFRDQDVYPITLLVQNRKHVESDICKMITMRDFDVTSQENEITSDIFYKDTLWDKYFFDSKTLKLLLKIYQNPKLSAAIKTVFSAATVSEAYEIKKVITDDLRSEGFKLINTGTIDRYDTLWGEKRTQYIKDNYLYPRVSSTDLAKINNNREHQASSSKIILAGMSKEIEAFYDESGEYLAGKSTTIILGEPSKLISLVGLLNSSLITFFVTHFYHSLKMAGGYLNIEPGIVSELPVPHGIFGSEIGSKVKELLSIKDDKERSLIETEINNMVFELYGLTEEEIRIVEGNND